MKAWQIIVLLLVISAIIYGVVLVNKANEYKVSVAQGLIPRTFVQNLINAGKTFEEIKDQAAANNILVLDSTETHTMEFNSRRVIIKRVQPNCLLAPCPEILTIESVG